MKQGELVAILGCGPAGLFAAKGIQECGGHPIIISRQVKSPIFGAQYLHRPIRGLTSNTPDGWIQGVKLGLEEHYAERVYGLSDEPTSWRKLKEEAPCWSLREAYDRAWEEFGSGVSIIDCEIDAADVGEFSAGFPLVISTIPRYATCYSGHDFISIEIIVEPGAINVPFSHENYIAYNGMQHGSWYRTSSIFGHASTEYVLHKDLHPEMRRDPNMKHGIKIVGNNCDCHPNVVFAGRFGLWKRGILTHHAYEAAIEAYTERFPSALHTVR